MLDKGQVVRRIGWENWEMFETFMSGRTVEYDEILLDLYYPEDVDAFERWMGLNK